MADIFVDTAGWASALIRTEQYHSQAAEIITRCQASHDRLMTTNSIIAELSALFVSPLRVPRTRQIEMLQIIRNASWVNIIHIDTHLDSAAFDLFCQRADKLWSLVDCASFVVMQELKLTDALTTDKHFEQAGFNRLLK